MSPSRSEDDAIESIANDRAGSPAESRQGYVLNSNRKRVEIKATQDLICMETNESPQHTEEEVVQLKKPRTKDNGLADYMTKVVRNKSPQGHYMSNGKMKSLSPRKKMSLLDTVFDDKS